MISSSRAWFQSRRSAVGQDDRYFFRDTDRQIVGARNGRVFKMGQRVHVLLDRIDRQQRRLQFALVPSREARELSRAQTVAQTKRRPGRAREPGRPRQVEEPGIPQDQGQTQR